MKRCPKCRKRVWVLKTRVPHDSGAGAFMFWDVCEAGCYLDPPETAAVYLDFEPTEVVLDFDTFGRSRVERDKQAEALEYAQRFTALRDRCLLAYCVEMELRHFRRARKLEAARHRWVHERVRPVVDIDALVLQLTAIETIAAHEATIRWSRGCVLVGNVSRPAKTTATEFKADCVMGALKSFDANGGQVPVGVGVGSSYLPPVGTVEPGAGETMGAEPAPGAAFRDAFGGKAGA